jgi:glyoxylase-like metal-dependent hydrolase (beta-lactamase superfamily II)
MHALPLLVTLAAAASAPKVHVHTAGEAGFYANAYLVEGPHAVVAIDAPFTQSEARAFKRELDAIGKPLVAVLVTHAHPDHVNGITALVAGGKVPIVALAGVADTLKAIDGPKRAYWAPIYKEEYPPATTFPDTVIAAGATVTYDGMTFRAHDLGKGESASETVWVLEGAEPVAFTGDLVMHGVHAWLAEGQSGSWLAALALAERELGAVKTIYPGHGDAAPAAAALAWQRRYLDRYRDAVRALAAGRTKLDDGQRKSLTAAMAKLVPGGKLAVLVGMSADAVAAELASAR